MAELRQNLITREWVIIASERSKRPHEFRRGNGIHRPPSSYESGCPFCRGNEHLTEAELYRIGEGADWRVRVVPNRYPALKSSGERVRKTHGIYRSMSAVGAHEVVVEHIRHDLTLALMQTGEVEDVFRSYRQRYSEIRKDRRVESIVIFKNHGEGAGTSLHHPHSQVVGTPIVPSQVRRRIDESVRYFDEAGECIFCTTLREELLARERIVHESEHFVAFIPYAALSPFHIWIFPRRHVSSFDAILDGELSDLALNARTVLAKLYHGLQDPDYNYSIRSIPTREGQTEYFHWYLTIVPRLAKTAGFEIGSGMYINPSLPEESAAFLRKTEIP
jgi:UDPglucose--hexose-1-phosphate uridylyltransferase